MDPLAALRLTGHNPPAAVPSASGASGSGAPLATLVARAQGGDADAFGEIFRRRADQVFRYTARLLRDSQRAEDASAETFLRAWETLPKLRAIDRFDAWLFRIAHHVATDELRRRHPEQLPARDEVAAASASSDPAAPIERRAEYEALREALLRLPERQRDVVVLRYFGGLGDDVIARQLDTTPGNVRVLRSRALKQLRRGWTPQRGG